MKIGSLLQYNPGNSSGGALFGIIIALAKIYDEEVATVLWNDGIVAHWRYEYFRDAEEIQIQVIKLDK